MQPTTRQAPGRHRREAVRGHRAPRTPLVLGDRGRTVVLAAAVLTGVGVAGVSASASPAHVSPAPVTAEAPAPVVNSGAEAGDSPSIATVDQFSDEDADIPAGALSFVRAGLKQRPVPVVPKILARWVNPLPEASVTSCFGQRWGRLHAGVDLAATDGTRIRAAGAGVVVAAGPAAGYGNAVLIDHGNGYLTHYGHMSVVLVQVGQHVDAGEQIGDEGSTGHSTGPHLHFEVHQGFYKNPIEPTRWMHDHGVDIPGCVTFTD